MVLNGNECSNALYNANHRELHVSTLMGFCLNKSFTEDEEINDNICRECAILWFTFNKMLTEL